MNNTKVVRKINRSKNKNYQSVLKNIGVSLGVVCVIEFMLVCLMAFIFTQINVAHNVYSYVAVVLPVVSIFLTTLLVGRISVKFDMLNGFLLGGVVFSVLLFISSVVMQNSLNEKTLYLAIMLTAASGIGSFFGNSLRYKRKIR